MKLRGNLFGALLYLAFIVYPQIAWGASPLSTYSLLSKGWLVFGDMAYRSNLLLHPDGGLVGVSISIVNKSADKPLQFSWDSKFPVPFIAYVKDSEERDLIPQSKQAAKRSPTRTQKTLAPGQVETWFLPVRGLVGPTYGGSEKENYSVSVILMAYQDDYKSSGHIGPEMIFFQKIHITKASLLEPAESIFLKVSKAAESPRHEGVK